MDALAALCRFLRPLRRLRAGRTFLDLIAPLKRWQFRVDCVHPHGWFDPVTFFFDKRLSAAGYMARMTEKGWLVFVHGERWV